jgi:hypothetical protein
VSRQDWEQMVEKWLRIVEYSRAFFLFLSADGTDYADKIYWGSPCEAGAFSSESGLFWQKCVVHALYYAPKDVWKKEVLLN